MIWAVSLLTTELIPHSLTPTQKIIVFGVWLCLVAWWAPILNQYLYPYYQFT